MDGHKATSKVIRTVPYKGKKTTNPPSIEEKSNALSVRVSLKSVYQVYTHIDDISKEKPNQSIHIFDLTA